MPAEGELVKRKREPDSDKEENGNETDVENEGPDEPIPSDPSPEPDQVGPFNPSPEPGHLADDEDSMSVDVASPPTSGRASADDRATPVDFSSAEFSAAAISGTNRSLGPALDYDTISVCTDRFCNCRVTKMLCLTHARRNPVARVATDNSESARDQLLREDLYVSSTDESSSRTPSSSDHQLDSEMCSADEQNSQPPNSSSGTTGEGQQLNPDSVMSCSSDEQNNQLPNSSSGTPADGQQLDSEMPSIDEQNNQLPNSSSGTTAEGEPFLPESDMSSAE